MASNPRMHASTGSELKPVDHSSPINNARLCRKEGAPEMMTNPNTHKTPHQDAKEQSKAQGQRADDFDGNVLMATSEIGQMLDELIAELDGVVK